MPDSTPVILGWARSAVASHGGAFKHLLAHQIAAPVVQGLLARVGLAPASVDAVLAGNALGAGGNPARLLALAAGLPEQCAAYSIDTQCCAGLDAVAMAAGLLSSGAASVVIAGGVEAWSRAPIRQHRPLRTGDPGMPYDRPAFTPDPKRDPDMLMAAAQYAAQHGYTREDQDRYALFSHERALAHLHDMSAEIVRVLNVVADTCVRSTTPERVARMPLRPLLRTPAAAMASQAVSPGYDAEHAQAFALSLFSISPKADGAAFVLMATREACERLGLDARMAWLGAASVGVAPEVPMLAAIDASRAILGRCQTSIKQMAAIELHDAFAVQALSFCKAFGLDVERLNRRGGGLARGHPIGASGAIALVRVLEDLALDEGPRALGLAAVAGAGGIGSAAIVQRLG